MIKIINTVKTQNCDFYVELNGVDYLVTYEENCIPEWQAFDSNGDVLVDDEITNKLIDFCRNAE